MSKFYTIGGIISRTGEPLHRVRYCIAKLDIEPLARAGQTRLFSEADVRRIEAELSREGRRYQQPVPAEVPAGAVAVAE